MEDKRRAIQVLILNTVAFTVCFAAWMANGVLVTFLTGNGLYDWDKVQIGWLIGIPVLTGSLMRLPVGILTDKYGGRRVYAILMLLSAIPMYMLSRVDSYTGFALASLGFGLTGASFAVGIAYSSVWFARKNQGTALGIFGAGNAGAAITSMGAPILLRTLTSGDAGLEGWRTLPKLYAASLAVMAILFWFLTFEKKVPAVAGMTLKRRLAPLGHMRVWRFGLYYFFVFGGFVALAQWLIPYYVNVYGVTLVMAGTLATIFTLPSGLIRALGGWMSDKLGARTVMYWVLSVSAVCCFFLAVPRMDIQAPGQGVMATRGGEVTAVSGSELQMGDKVIPLVLRPEETISLTNDPSALIWPHFEFWQEPVVVPGQTVERKELLARGVTHIYFQANVWIFTALVFVLGIAMGIGKAAVYKHIPDYFPDQVGVVGGIVGVLGGLGGFVCPILFGYMLKYSGIWTTNWMFFLGVIVTCLVWMHLVIRRLMLARVPEHLRDIEDVKPGAAPALDEPVRPAGTAAEALR
jgi:NNP family nitrate/nitrite transporter-like MFS transporter